MELYGLTKQNKKGEHSAEKWASFFFTSKRYFLPKNHLYFYIKGMY